MEFESSIKWNLLLGSLLYSYILALAGFSPQTSQELSFTSYDKQVIYCNKVKRIYDTLGFRANQKPSIVLRNLSEAIVFPIS